MDPQLLASVTLMISVGLGTAVRRQCDRTARSAMGDYLDFLATELKLVRSDGRYLPLG